MAKKVQAMVKLQLPAAKATPAPPVGTALGPQGVNIMEFCKQFNAKTNKEPEGMIIPVLVTIFSDRSFTFITQTPPASELLKRAAGIGRGCRNRETSPFREIRRDGGVGYQPRRGSETLQPDGARHGRIAQRSGQVQARAGDCQRRKDSRGAGGGSGFRRRR